jgi:hypothetical protein
MTSTQVQEASPLALVPMIFGYVTSRMITAAVRVGLTDEMGDAAKSTTELAAATSTNEDSIRRLLRALTALGLASQEGANRFRLSGLGSYLRSDAEGSMYPLAMMASDGAMWQAWGAMEYSLRTGRPAFDQALGRGLFDYFAENEKVADHFHDTMASNARIIAPAIVDGYNFASFTTVVDVGGGNGTLIAAILGANPKVRGVVFDTADGLKDAPDVLKRAAVYNRCNLHQGDFFKSIPPGGDAYLLKNVLNDWDDERAALILRHCAQAIGTEGKVLVVAAVMPVDARSEDAMVPVMGDIEMMVTTGGKERGLEDYRRLFAQNGLRLGRVVPLTVPTYAVIEALPA